jgi:hypothetical protein
MKFLCLCAIYNHRQELTESLLQMWLDQTHKDSVLVFIDDRPPEMSLERHGGIVGGLENVHIFYNSRYPNLMAKYTAGIEFAAAKGIEWDAVCVMDDDDVYLPRYLEYANDSLLADPTGWVHPETVPTFWHDRLVYEPTNTRFWASCVTSRAAFEAIGGFGDSPKASFDQDYIRRLVAYRERLQPRLPQYIYIWMATQDSHASGMMIEGEAGAAWYGQTSVSCATGPLVPTYSDLTLQMLFELRAHMPELLYGE